MERRCASGPPTGFSSANRKGRSLLFISRTRWIGNSKGAWRIFSGGMVSGFARARLGERCGWLLYHFGWEDFEP